MVWTEVEVVWLLAGQLVTSGPHEVSVMVRVMVWVEVWVVVLSEVVRAEAPRAMTRVAIENCILNELVGKIKRKVNLKRRKSDS